MGLPIGVTRRRVPGLRQEELALLAGVSPDYYVWLEQGRAAHVSGQVLDAVARALALSDVELEHLRNPARPPRHDPADVRDRLAVVLEEPLARLLGALGDAPVLLVDDRLDIVGWNGAAEVAFEVTAILRPRNGARELFLHPEARSRYLNWGGGRRDRCPAAPRDRSPAG